MTVTDTITAILKAEGWDEYTNHPADRGGPTKWGITEKRWREFKKDLSADVRDISEVEARLFYMHEYIQKPKFDLIESDLVRHLVVDCGVNHGVTRATKWLQRAVGVTQDGILGPQTLFAVNSADKMPTFLRISAYRIKLYGRLVTADSSQAVFAAGWNNRAASFLLDAAEELS
jgi:lysozyme family protein